jgi:hypothetical protein
LGWQRECPLSSRWEVGELSYHQHGVKKFDLGEKLRRIAPTILVILVLLLPLPPLFTAGACTREFEQTTGDFERLKDELLTLSTATAYLSAHHIPYGTVSPERCEQSPPRDVVVCPGGPILIVAVPVKNRICRYYRDSTIRQQLGFNRTEQLVRLQTDMNPFHFLKVPFLSIEVAWAK